MMPAPCTDCGHLVDHNAVCRTIPCLCSCHAPISAQNAPQPPPKPGTARPTWDLVVADLDERAATLQLLRADAVERDLIGAAKYGVRHQHDNGRDHLVDAYQENLDQGLYLRAEIERRKVLTDALELSRTMLDVAARTLGRLTRQDISEVKASLLADAKALLAFMRSSAP